MQLTFFSFRYQSEHDLPKLTELTKQLCQVLVNPLEADLCYTEITADGQRTAIRKAEYKYFGGTDIETLQRLPDRGHRPRLMKAIRKVMNTV